MLALGLSSKREIARTRIRVRTAMATQTREQGRYLGGRPPYGYRLADAGPHPSKMHAAWGRRAHRLEPDPATAPVVRWMFAQRLAGLRVGRPAVRRHTWPAPAGASAAAAIAVTLIFSAGLAGTFAPLPPASPTPAPPAPAGPPASQILTQSAAEHVADAVTRYLGAAWIPGSFPAPAPAVVTYQPAGCAALAHEDYLNALPRPLARAEDRYKAAPALPSDGLETLSVRVESFARPVPASMLTAATRIFRACPRYTTQTSGSQVAGSNGPSFVTTRTVSKTGSGVTVWRADISMNLDPGSASVTWIMITAGHNFLLISQQTISPASGSLPDEKVIAAAVTATVDALARTMASPTSAPGTGP